MTGASQTVYIVVKGTGREGIQSILAIYDAADLAEAHVEQAREDADARHEWFDVVQQPLRSELDAE